MQAKEVIQIIEHIKSQPGIKLQLNKLSEPTIREVAARYNLQVFDPQDHPMNFTFCKGYYDFEGKITGSRIHAAGSFSMTSKMDFPEEVLMV